ncbi:unnamed protein product [Ceutorhynchus assimilis]|uniref:Protein sleepless n=1 Tax=Ceutorhynchus assimilis TaxID=467358 RepID=A0A9N9QLB3_9CUCU|nr:unnamed protein product [Ceutorhynchus assimilis]
MKLMDCLSVILVLLIQNILTSEAIQCYRCVVAPYVYFSNGTLLCQDFDYSNRFIVDCPYSTFCVKINTYATLNDIQINGTERDCAAQKLDTQQLKNGKWHPETLVMEPYDEACKLNQDKGLRTAIVEHCYCRGELCNAGNRVISMKLFLSVMGTLMTHLVAKFVL